MKMERNAQGQFTKEVDFVNGDYDELQHALWEEEHSQEARSEEDEREIALRESERKAEVEFLASAEDLEQFCQARERGRIRFPAQLSSDMSLAEFSKARRRT